jgi:hypothetical protein
MKAFGLAFTIWGGTIATCCSLIAFFGIFTFDGMAIMLGVIGFIMSLLVTSPLLLGAALLIQLAAKIPYNNTIRIYWLGFTLILLDYLFFQLLNFIMPDWDILNVFFFPSTIGLVFMLAFRRTAIKNFFTQQTTNKNL